MTGPLNLKQILATLDGVDLTSISSWDNRKTLLDIFYEGRNRDYLADEDDFHKNHGGLIAVAQYAASEAIKAAGYEFDDGFLK